MTSPSWRRLGLTLLLVLGWLLLLPLLWNAFSTLPSAERLAESRMARIPTLQAFLFIAGRSAAELLGVLALTWPRSRLYATRLAATTAGLLVYFLFSAPLSLTRMAWLHRRWLALVLLTLFAALVIELIVRAARRSRGRLH
jgi:hypothetical protein